ncbi:MAG: hypothetical protein R2843_08665 [Thermomicrobiales bacterium]
MISNSNTRWPAGCCKATLAGKTVVAAITAWLAYRNGLQSVLLAPTEILAEQHAAGLTRIFAALPDG